MKALELKNLSKTYPPRARGLEPKIAVSDLSFTIEQGEVFGFLGPNGAGKSTTIGMISGLVQPTSGSAQVFGHDCVRDAYTTRGMVGLVPQELSFDPFFTPREALEIQSGLFNVPKDRRWTEEILERLSLAPVADNHVRTLSGGMKRRLLVAKALVHKPKLLILDEPTAGVDVELRRDLWAFVKELNAQGTTILLTTHHMEEVEAMAQRIAIMSNGVLRALDTLSGLRASSGKEKLEDIYLHYTSTMAAR